MNNFHYIAVLLDQLYGVQIEEADLEELGLIAWGLIGNRVRKLYRYSTVINPIDNSITLPCNAYDLSGENCIELVKNGKIPYIIRNFFLQTNLIIFN